VGRLPLVRHTLSEETLLRQIDEGLNGPSAAARWLSYPDAVVQQLRVAARSAGLSEMDDYSTPDGSRRRILILTDYMSSRELHELSDSVARITSQFLPANVRASVQGTTVLWANMDGEIGRTQVTSIIVLAGVFVVLLPLLFRSIRLGLLGILINGLPLAMTFGLMGLLDIRLNMATALIGGVSIGSTVDSTLFFLNRFQMERGAGRSWNDAIEAAVRGVGDGILITTGILAGGFLCMTVSSFRPTADFGIFTCFTILTGAFLDIIIDPILLGLFAPRLKLQAQVSPATRLPKGKRIAA
jgi:predicted RND superfamily exporter protein